MRRVVIVALSLVVILGLSIALVGPALAIDPISPLGQNGTTLMAEKTATGYWTRTITYDWSLTKSASPALQTIASGATGTFNYTLVATKTQVGQTDKFGVTGQICVTNGGAVATQNLTLVDQVEYKTGSGQFQPLAGATQTITPDQLAAGASACYPYDISFTPVAGAQYRNTVKVTITNHSGNLGQPFGPEPKADFTMPGSPTIVEVDGTASIADSLTCPAGFTCTYNPAGPWPVSATGEVRYAVVVKNVSAPCDNYFTMGNTATLTEGTSKQTRQAMASVQIYTGACPSGCTLTIGYWKTHAGFTGNNADRVSKLLPIWLGTASGPKSVQVTTASQAVGLLSMGGDASNGINKLYAQLLGAKLNIKNGADGSAVASTISAADAFLATHNASSWSGLTKAEKQQVNSWMTTLDNYNNGLIGPSHCG